MNSKFEKQLREQLLSLCSTQDNITHANIHGYKLADLIRVRQAQIDAVVGMVKANIKQDVEVDVSGRFWDDAMYYSASNRKLYKASEMPSKYIANILAKVTGMPAQDIMDIAYNDNTDVYRGLLLELLMRGFTKHSAD